MIRDEGLSDSAVETKADRAKAFLTEQESRGAHVMMRTRVIQNAG